MLWHKSDVNHSTERRPELCIENLFIYLHFYLLTYLLILIVVLWIFLPPDLQSFVFSEHQYGSYLLVTIS